MRSWLWTLDGLLRGEATKDESLAGGSLRVPVFGLAVLIDLLGFIYGACMGLYALTGTDHSHWMQVPASMVKVPALFLLTLIITVPSLYTFSALMGSRLRFLAVVRLAVAAVAVMLGVLTSLGPIVGFFAVSTTSYPFMLMLNVVVFAIAGVLGLRFLLKTMHKLTAVITREADAGPTGGGPNVAPASASFSAVIDASSVVEPDRVAASRLRFAAMPRSHGARARAVFYVWLIVFGLVGGQMGWVLRPFVGNPKQPFTWLRPRQSNFFEAVAKTTGNLLGIDEKTRW